eukprot:g696.t1
MASALSAQEDEMDVETAVNEQEIYEKMYIARRSRTKHRTEAILPELATVLEDSDLLSTYEKEQFDRYVNDIRNATPQHAQANVSFEKLCRRMVQYARNACVGRHRLDASLVVNILNTLSRVISIDHPYQEVIDAAENGNLVSAEHHADRNIEDKDLSKFKQQQVQLGSFGAVDLVIELIARTPCPDAVFEAALNLGTMLVFEGNDTVQKAYVDRLRGNRHSESFFAHLKTRLKRIEDQIARELRTRKLGASTREYKSPLRHLVSRIMLFQQNLCEGHFNDLQLVLVDQQTHCDNNRTSNLLAASIQLLLAYVPGQAALQTITSDDATDIWFILAFLIEIVGGPQHQCQKEIADADGALECLKQLYVSDFGMLQETEKTLTQQVKTMAIKALGSLVEGRDANDGSIHSQVGDILPPSLMKRRITQNYEQWPAELRRIQKKKEPRDDSDQVSKADESWKSFSLLLGDEARDAFSLAYLLQRYDQMYRDEGMDPERHTHSITAVALPNYADTYAFFHGERKHEQQPKLESIEILWHKQLRKVMFIRPPLCQQLKKPLKKRVLSKIDFTSATKVRDFMEMVKITYREMVHCDKLYTKYPIVKSISLNLVKYRQFIFLLAMVINFIILISSRLQMPHQRRPCSSFWQDRLPTRLQSHRFAYYYNAAAHWEDACVVPIFLNTLAAIQALFSMTVIVVLAKQRWPVAKEMYSGPDAAESENNSKDVRGWSLRLADNCRQFLHFVYLCLKDHVLISLILFAMASYVTSGNLPLWMVCVAVLYIIMSAPKRFDKVLNKNMGNSSVGNGVVIRRMRSTIAARYMQVSEVLGFHDIWFYIFHLLCCVLGVLVSPFFFSPQLMEAVKVSPTLGAVVEAVTKSGLQLALATILALFVLYMFASAAFFFMPEHLRSEEDHYIFSNKRRARSISETFLDFVHLAIVEGQGSLTERDAQNREGAFAARFLFDVLFFITFIVLLLNMIFGIIVDKFGQLRDEQAERDKMHRELCFICGIKKADEDAKGLLRGEHNAFQNHIDKKHSYWSYFNMFIYLLAKNETEYTGADTFLSDQLSELGVDWLPLREKADQEAGAQESSQQGKVTSAHTSVERKLAELEKKIEKQDEMLKQILSALRLVALYDTISAENGLLARHGELLYKLPVSVLKSETNKLVRKAGQDAI